MHLCTDGPWPPLFDSRAVRDFFKTSAATESSLSRRYILGVILVISHLVNMEFNIF